MIIAPVLGFAGAALALVGMRYNKAWAAFGGSSASTVGDRRDRGPVDVPVHPAQQRSIRAPA
jgi:hypothetical protein